MWCVLNAYELKNYWPIYSRDKYKRNEKIIPYDISITSWRLPNLVVCETKYLYLTDWRVHSIQANWAFQKLTDICRDSHIRFWGTFWGVIDMFTNVQCVFIFWWINDLRFHSQVIIVGISTRHRKHVCWALHMTLFKLTKPKHINNLYNSAIIHKITISTKQENRMHFKLYPHSNILSANTTLS